MKPQTVKTIRVRTIRFAISAIYENRRDTFLDDVDVDTCIDSRKCGFHVFHTRQCRETSTKIINNSISFSVLHRNNEWETFTVRFTQH